MQKRSFLKFAALAVLAGSIGLGSAQAQSVIKIGAVAPKTGPLAGGSAVTHWPNIKLWIHQVNARGGLTLKSGKATLELIEYDDRTNPGETIKAIERLATQDKVDFILAPYGTGFNLAAAPIFAKYGYPLITSTAITDKAEELIARYDNIFFTLGDTSTFSHSVVGLLAKMRDEGKMGNRIAMVNVADAFGIELANAARPVFKEAGFEIVYDKSYPLGTQDLSPVVRGAKASNPDAFVAWSYPPDTFGLTELAIIEGLDVKAFYAAVATAFPAYVGRFKESIEGVLGAGGINPNTPEMQAYIKAHTEVTGQAPDSWASPVVYATYQILEQAIEAVGSTDRKAVTAHIRSNVFDTVIGPIDLRDQVNHAFWTVGQWQGGVFNAVSSTGRPGVKDVQVKPTW